MEQEVISTKFYQDQSSISFDYLEFFKLYLKEQEYKQNIKLQVKRGKLAKKILLIKAKAKKLGIIQGKTLYLSNKLKEYLKIQNLYQETIKNVKAECLALTLNIIETLIATKFNTTKTLANKICRELENFSKASEIKIKVNSKIQSEIRKICSDNNLEIQINDNLEIDEAEIITTSGAMLISIKEHFKIVTEYLKEKNND